MLTDQVALVTGGSRGIGRAIARALVAEGAHVVITGRNETSLAAAAASIRGDSSDALATILADVRHVDDVQRATEFVMARFGGLDILVNNAGVGIFGKVADMTASQWRDVIDTNLTGVFHVCHAVIPLLKKRGGGFIINVSSLAGKNPFAGGAAYCASKAGLNAFSEALMQELRYDNIRVSYVLPGSVATAFSGDESTGAEWKLAPDDVATVIVDLLKTNPRSLPSCVELRPSRPKK